MADFRDHIEPLVVKEGGYKLVKVPGDRGGRTYAGISERANPEWRGWALIDRGAPPPEIQAAVHERYRERYWSPIRGDGIEHDDVAEVLFSSAVLSGPRTAVKMAQMAVEADPDGIMGPRTLDALNRTGPDLFEARFALMRINRYLTIANRDRSQRKFLRGWLNRVFGELET